MKDINGYTPLHRACMGGYLETAEQLVIQKADVNIQDKEGWTPLHWSCKLGKLSKHQYYELC